MSKVGVTSLVLAERGAHLLAVWHPVTVGWELPGAILGRGETPEDGALRCLREHFELRLLSRQLSLIYSAPGYGDHTYKVFRAALESGNEPRTRPDATLPYYASAWILRPTFLAGSGTEGFYRLMFSRIETARELVLPHFPGKGEEES